MFKNADKEEIVNLKKIYNTDGKNTHVNDDDEVLIEEGPDFIKNSVSKRKENQESLS